MTRALVTMLWLLAACGPSAPSAPAQDAAARGADAQRSVLDGGVAELLDAAASAEAPPAEDAGLDAAAFAGVVRGRVRLAPGAKLPLAPPPLLNGKPPPESPPCPPVNVHDQRTVSRSAKGGLSPVHLAITQMEATLPRAPRVHEVFVDGCRLRPTMVAAMRGDKVRVTNRTETPLLMTLPGDSFLRGLLPREPREFTLERLGRITLRCGLTNYCGESMVIAVSHPLFAITDKEGAFSIEGVPLDQELKLHAYHPLFEVATETFTVTADKPERRIELTLTPKPSGAPAKPPSSHR